MEKKGTAPFYRSNTYVLMHQYPVPGGPLGGGYFSGVNCASSSREMNHLRRFEEARCNRNSEERCYSNTRP